jgi:hypothetical protein
MDDTSSTIRQRELGVQLRELREEHSLTVEDVAGELMCSMAKTRRLETDNVIRASGTGAHTTTATSRRGPKLLGLVREAREQGWWNQYVDLTLRCSWVEAGCWS